MSLLLLYGQQLSRIAVMTTSQITIRDNAVLVRFGDHDVPVPDRRASSSPSRTALTDLAAQMPAAVLADLLHIAPGTAVRWMRQAGGDWSDYAAELARTRHHQP